MGISRIYKRVVYDLKRKIDLFLPDNINLFLNQGYSKRPDFKYNSYKKRYFIKCPKIVFCK